MVTCLGCRTKDVPLRKDRTMRGHTPTGSEWFGRECGASNTTAYIDTVTPSEPRYGHTKTLDLAAGGLPCGPAATHEVLDARPAEMSVLIDGPGMLEITRTGIRFWRRDVDDIPDPPACQARSDDNT